MFLQSKVCTILTLPKVKCFWKEISLFKDVLKNNGDLSLYLQRLEDSEKNFKETREGCSEVRAGDGQGLSLQSPSSL